MLITLVCFLKFMSNIFTTGQIRHNHLTNQNEIWDGSKWVRTITGVPNTGTDPFATGTLISSSSTGSINRYVDPKQIFQKLRVVEYCDVLTSKPKRAELQYNLGTEWVPIERVKVYE